MFLLSTAGKRPEPFIIALGLLSVLTLGVPSGYAEDPMDELTAAQQQQLGKEAARLNAQALQSYTAGKYPEATRLLKEALAMRQKLYPPRQYPKGRSDLAQNLNDLALLLEAQGEYGQALDYHQQALRMKQQLYPKECYPQGHPDLAKSLNNLGLVLEAQGEYGQALDYFRQALRMYQRLYPRESYPQGHPQLATSLNNVGFLLDAKGEYGQALDYYQQALRMRQQLYPKERYPQGHPQLAASLSNLGFLLQAQEEYGKALPYFRQALRMYQQLFPKERYPQGHPQLATSLNNLGALLVAQGECGQALDYYRQALRMRQELYPKERFPQGHPLLAASLSNLGFLLQAQEEYGKALPYFQQALQMRQQLFPKERYPQGHPDLATSLNNLGALLVAQGECGQALDYYRQALRMRQELYPKERYPQGHPDLALSLNNLGSLLLEQAEYGKALDYYRQALHMYQQLYPKGRYPQGHPDLAVSLNNLGGLLLEHGEYGQALDYLQQALQMRQQLYPKGRYPQGHPDLAQSLNNLGLLLKDQGEYGQALDYLQQALQMRQQLYPQERYPQGHPHLAATLDNLGLLQQAQGEYIQALDYFQQALRMDRKLLTAFGDTASEAEALNYRARLPQTRDAFLSVSAELSDASPDGLYPLLWHTKGAVADLLLRRRELLRATTDEATRQAAEDLLDARRQLARLLLAPADAPTKDRAGRLQELTERKERLERELVRHLPELARQQALERAPHTDLVDHLPERTAFLDLWRYNRRGKGPKAPASPRYVAFVLQKGKAVRRVDLGPARPIEQALEQWRRDIANRHAGIAAEQLRRLVWEPLAGQLQPGTNTVYVSPDGALAGLPWAALPGDKPGTVLLENHTFALVPHGPFLLDQLTRPPRPAGTTGALLAVGGVRYDEQPQPADDHKPEVRRSADLGQRGKLTWDPLPGSGKELDALLAVADRLKDRPEVIQLRERQAGTDRVLLGLPQARWAHVATHGFFAAPDSGERKHLLREEEFSLGRRGGRFGAGARNPLVQTGLVLAGANLPPKEDVLTDDRGLLTGEAIASLDLRGMDLAVLSACDTGLGEAAGGEGVFGLQRAFHLGGCRDVVASLWKVDDESTTALMALFYHNLWEEGQQPLDALRAAQLTLLRHPRAVPELARARQGKIFGEVVKRVQESPPEPPAAGEQGPAPVKHWAAFILSGLGR
jgi:tetratricopeptide (TPR) repeat protein